VLVAEITELIDAARRGDAQASERLFGALYDELRREGRVPPPSDDYFARLGYMDVTRTTSVSRHIGTRELNLYQVLGMSAFYVIGYTRYPRRILRTLRNFRANRSETVLEQRLGELKRRWARRREAGAAWRPLRSSALPSVGSGATRGSS